MIGQLPDHTIARRFLLLWTVVALLLTGVNFSHALQSYYSYPHGWISANFSVIARTFADFGITTFGGVPVANNPPFGRSPEAYLHWPPLFSFVLAIVYRFFGSSETVSHALMLVLLLLNTFFLGILTRRCLGAIAALLAVLVWLGSDVVALYGHLAWNLHLMMAFGLLALLGFVNGKSSRQWEIVGVLSLALAVASSWEAVFLCPGLLVASLWTRDRRRIRLASLYCLAALATVAAIFLNSAYHYPQQMAETWQRALFRMGIARGYVLNRVTGAQQNFEVPSIAPLASALFRRHLDYVGRFPLIAVAWLLVSAIGSYRDRRREEAVVVLTGLVSMWLLWTVVFHSLVFIHDCWMLIAVPAAAFSAGWVGQSLVGALEHLLPHGAWPQKMLLIVALPVVLLSPLASAARHSERFVPLATQGPLSDPAGSGGVQFGLDLLRSTESNSVVITPVESAVPLYYSRRHLIQGVNDDGGVASVLAYAHKNFPASPIYLAVPTDLRGKYPEALGKSTVVRDFSSFILAKLPSEDRDQKRD